MNSSLILLCWLFSVLDTRFVPTSPKCNNRLDLSLDCWLASGRAQEVLYLLNLLSIAIFRVIYLNGFIEIERLICHLGVDTFRLRMLLTIKNVLEFQIVGCNTVNFFCKASEERFCHKHDHKLFPVRI